MKLFKFSTIIDDTCRNETLNTFVSEDEEKLFKCPTCTQCLPWDQLWGPKFENY